MADQPDDAFAFYVLYTAETGAIYGTRSGNALHVESIPTPFLKLDATPSGNVFTDYTVQNGALVAKST